MRFETRWLIWAGVLVVALILIGVLRGLQPVADDSVTDLINVPTTHRAGPPPQESVEANITVSDEEIDRVFDQMLEMLDELSSGREGGGPDARQTDGTENRRAERREEDVSQDSMDSAAPMEEDSRFAEETVRPETMVDNFISAVQNLDIDTMLSMARGQARSKIEELRRETLPAEARAMFGMIQATNGRLVNQNEFRFSLRMPMEQNSPEIVMHRDGGRWWIDEIVE